MGTLEAGTLAIQGFWDDFSMVEAEMIFEWIKGAEMPNGVIQRCPECGKKHIFAPQLRMLHEMGDVAEAIRQAEWLTTEARQEFGDPTLMAWWWDDFNRATIELAQEMLQKADVFDEIRAECGRKLEYALYFLSNAEWMAQEVVVRL